MDFDIILSRLSCNEKQLLICYHFLDNRQMDLSE